MNCYPIENHPHDSRVKLCTDGIVQTLPTRMGTGGNNTPFVLINQRTEEPRQVFVANSSGDGIACPLDASYYKGCGLRQGIEREFVMTEAYMAGNGQLDQVQLDTVSRTLDCMHDQKMVLINKQHYYTKQAHGEYVDGKVASALKERDYKEYTDVVQEEHQKKYVLRRLTPTECARLQGFPDWWCDGANGSDSSQYKLWGNGVALPCVAMVLENIAMDAMKGETNE